MVEEQIILKNTYIEYISQIADLQDKKNNQGWKTGSMISIENISIISVSFFYSGLSSFTK